MFNSENKKRRKEALKQYNTHADAFNWEVANSGQTFFEHPRTGHMMSVPHNKYTTPELSSQSKQAVDHGGPQILSPDFPVASYVPQKYTAGNPFATYTRVEHGHKETVHKKKKS